MATRQPRQGSGRQAKRSGATTRRAPRKQARRGIPGWLWGLAGLVAGFFLAQYVQQSAPTPLATVLPKPPASAPEQPATPGEGESDEPRMPTFEFYTLLPESEVIAPRSDSVAPPRPQPVPEVAATTPATPAPDDTPPDDAEAADPIAAELVRISEAMERQAQADSDASDDDTPADSDQSRYMLQAASFRETGDAERLAGRLRDFGLRANITQVQSGGGETWHRVQVGPYEERSEINRAQDLMSTQGIEPLLIRLQN